MTRAGGLRATSGCPQARRVRAGSRVPSVLDDPLVEDDSAQRLLVAREVALPGGEGIHAQQIRTTSAYASGVRLAGRPGGIAARMTS